MRIISGKYKSRKLNEVKQVQTRQTADFVRENVFNLIKIEENTNVLDLFAGSASYALEAVSRGCIKPYLNDISKNAIKVINDNLKMLDIKDYYITNLDYDVALDIYIKNKYLFDYIFIDPPYDFKYYDKLLNKLLLLIKPSSTIIVETHFKTIIKNDNFDIIKDRKYGIKRIYILQKKENDTNAN